MDIYEKSPPLFFLENPFEERPPTPKTQSGADLMKIRKDGTQIKCLARGLKANVDCVFAKLMQVLEFV